MVDILQTCMYDDVADASATQHAGATHHRSYLVVEYRSCSSRMNGISERAAENSCDETSNGELVAGKDRCG